MNKKIFVGVTAVSLVGAAVVGSLIGGYFARKNALKDIEDVIVEAKKSNANLLESEKISAKSGVKFNASMSLVSPLYAKVAFVIPAKYTGTSLTLFYKTVSSIKQPNAITLTTAKTESDQNISFVLNVLANTTYEYQLASSATPNDTLFYSRLKSSKMPVVSATGAFRSANVELSSLEDYKSRTLVLKAVEKSVYDTYGKDSFTDSFLSKDIFINSKEDKKKVWFKPVGNKTIKDEVEYVLMLFDQKGLVPVLDQPVSFKTTLNKVEVKNVQGGAKVANLTVANLEPYQGKELLLAYRKVESVNSFFRPTNKGDKDLRVEKLVVPTFEEGKEAALNSTLTDLEPNSIYKLQIFDSKDTELTDGFLLEAVTIATKKQPTVQPMLDGKPNPQPEVHAAYIKLTDFSDYMDKTTGSLAGLSLKYQEKSTTLKPWNSTELKVEQITSMTPGEIYAGIPILGLKPSTEYVYQVFATVTGDEPLLESNQEFATKAGFTSAGVKPSISLTKEGQTKATITLTGQELAQFFNENSDNTLELRYTTEPASVTTAATATTPARTFVPEVDWSAESVKKMTTTVSLTSTTGTYSAASFNLTNLEAGKKYLFAIFMSPNQLADVMVDKSSFMTREQVNGTVVPLSTKAVLYTNELKSYVGTKYELSYYPKTTGEPAAADIVTLAEATVPASGVIEATFGTTEKPLTASKEYTYKIKFIDGTDKHEVASAEFTTKASQFTTPVVENSKVYPISLTVDFSGLEGLKDKELQLVYRKKGQTDQTVDKNAFTPTMATHSQELKNLTHLTEYEINFVLKNAPSQLLSDIWVSATTKDIVNLTSSEVSATSFKVGYEKVDTYQDTTLTLKYWKSTATGDEKEQAPTDSTKVTEITVNVTKTGEVVSAPASVLAALDPQTKYSFQLFKNTVEVSYVHDVTTLNQVKVEKVESFIASANVILTNLQTIEGDANTDLKLILVEVTDGQNTEPTYSSAGAKVVEFKKGSEATMNLLVEGLTKEKSYILQVFKASDTRLATPLITTKLDNPDDKRKFKLLDNSTTPKVETQAISNSSAKLKISNLDAFKGQTLVLKYKSTYWNTMREAEFVVPNEKGEDDDNITRFEVIKELFPHDPNRDDVENWFYEVYVKVNGDSSKIQLITPSASSDDVKTFFKTNNFAQVTSELVVSSELQIKVKNLLDYKNNTSAPKQFLKLKVAPKLPNMPVDWSTSTTVTATQSTIKSSQEGPTNWDNITDNNTEEMFKVSWLNENTDYVYQLFVDGLDEPILAQEGSFRTKANLKLKVEYTTNSSAKLLISNAASYVGQTLRFVYYLNSGNGTGPTASTAKIIDITIDDNSFQDGMFIPILLEDLEGGKTYNQLKITMVSSSKDSAGRPLWETNSILDPENDTSLRVGKDTKVGLIMAYGNEKDPEVILGGNEEGAGIENYLKGKTLVLSYINQANENDVHSIEFTIPKDYNEKTFAINQRLVGLTSTGSKQYKLKLTDKNSEFSGEVNFLGKTEVSFTESNLTLSRLSKKTEKKDVNQLTLADVNTLDKWKANFEPQTLEGYTVVIDSVTPNATDNTMLLTQTFTKSGLSVTKTIAISGFKEAETTATPAATLAP